MMHPGNHGEQWCSSAAQFPRGRFPQDLQYNGLQSRGATARGSTSALGGSKSWRSRVLATPIISIQPMARSKSIFWISHLALSHHSFESFECIRLSDCSVQLIAWCRLSPSLEQAKHCHCLLLERSCILQTLLLPIPKIAPSSLHVLLLASSLPGDMPKAVIMHAVGQNPAKLVDMVTWPKSFDHPNGIVAVTFLSLTNSWRFDPHLFPLSGGFLQLIQPGEVQVKTSPSFPQKSIQTYTIDQHPTVRVFISKKNLISCFDKANLTVASCGRIPPSTAFGSTVHLFVCVSKSDGFQFCHHPFRHDLSTFCMTFAMRFTSMMNPWSWMAFDAFAYWAPWHKKSPPGATELLGGPRIRDDGVSLTWWIPGSNKLREAKDDGF